jgi:hypothetical protein
MPFIKSTSPGSGKYVLDNGYMELHKENLLLLLRDITHVIQFTSNCLRAHRISPLLIMKYYRDIKYERKVQ